MKPKVLAAFAIGFWVLFGAKLAWSDGIVGGPCGGGPFVGPDSPLFACVFGDGTSVSYGGSATADLNFFANHTSPVHVVSTLPGGERTAVITVDSFPNWNVPFAQTFLRLDGLVTIEAGFVDILFQGFLGALLVDQVSVHFDTPGVHPLGIADFNPMAPTGTPATSILTVTVHSIARYDAVGSPTFIGMPEPSSLLLLFGGMAALVAIRGRRPIRNCA